MQLICLKKNWRGYAIMPPTSSFCTAAYEPKQVVWRSILRYLPSLSCPVLQILFFNIIICACWQLLLSLGIWWSQHTESATAILGYWWNALWRKSDLPNSEPAGRMCRLGWAVSSFKVRKFLAGTCCNQLSL